MNKHQVQKRIYKNDNLLDLDLFQWDENGKILRTDENNLRCYFREVDSLSIYFGSDSYIEAGNNSVIRGLSRNEIKIGDNGDIKGFDSLRCLTGDGAYFNIGSYCDVLVGNNSKGTVKDSSIIQVLGSMTINTGDNCKILSGGNSVIRMGSNGIIYREDTFEIIDMDGVKRGYEDISRYDLKIELNGNAVKGYRVVPRYGY